MKRTILLLAGLALALSGAPSCKKVMKKVTKEVKKQTSGDSSDMSSGGGGGGGSELSPEEEKDRQLSMKLQPYIKMTNQFTGRVYDSRNRYASWLKDFEKGPTCKERHVYGLYTISEVEGALKEVEKVQGSEPKLQDLEEGAVKYTSGLKKLFPLLKKADRYYQQGDYKEDGCKQAKELHPELVAAWKEFEEGDKLLGKAIEKYNTGLHYRLLDRIGKQFGKTSDRYYHKKVTLDARALLMLLRFESREKEPNHEKIATEVKAFDTLVQEMEENTKGKSSLSWFQSSSNAYVQAAKEMMRHMKEGKKFSRTEQNWIARGSGWMVRGSYDAVLKKFNDLIDKSNSVRF
ncbi:MAG: DUF3829 domain-containing protein [Polyangia bacterium]|nr:DUF3829 domain-containing protein [Polyangia bacterium]